MENNTLVLQWIYTIGFRLITLCKAMENSLKKKNNQSSMYNAILKYGHENLSFTIIE